jgi:thioredoxin-related protein
MLFSAAAVCLMLIQGLAEETGDWLTDFPKAQARAKSESKLVLMDFTGSDYCAPCKALAKRVFSQPEFINYAKTNLVLVEVDFPLHKPQAEELRKTNEALEKQFKVEGYPTVIMLNFEGKELQRWLGYEGESVAEFIAKLEKLKK